MSPSRRAPSSKTFHIRCDMEGVTGVVSMAQVTPGSAEYAEAREWFMAELLALVEGLQEGGADSISIYDEHWFGRNVDLSRVPAGVSVFCGKPPYRADWAGGLDASCSGLILHGLHSMAGTGQTLCHTYEPDFQSITLNGVTVGEIGLETAVAGDWEVPLQLVVADSAGAEEARAIVKGVETVATKVSQAIDGAECFPLADNIAAIREAARRVAADPPATAPWKIASPVTMRCSFRDGAYLEELRAQAARHFENSHTLCLRGETVTSLWAEYWQMKLAVQAALARGL